MPGPQQQVYVSSYSCKSILLTSYVARERNRALYSLWVTSKREADLVNTLVVILWFSENIARVSVFGRINLSDIENRLSRQLLDFNRLLRQACLTGVSGTTSTYSASVH